MIRVPMIEPSIFPRPPNRLAPSDHHCGDGVEVVGHAGSGRGGPEPAHDQDTVDAGQQAGDRVDLHQMALPRKAGPDGGLPAVADGVGVRPVPGLGQREAGDDAEHGGDQHRHRDPAQQVLVAERPHPRRDGGDLLAVVDQVAQAGRDPQGAERDDEGRDMAAGDQPAVQQPERQADGQRGGEPGGDGERRAGPAAHQARHDPATSHAGQAQDRADRQVDPARDDDERLAQREQQDLGRGGRGIQPVQLAQEVRRPDGEPHDQGDQDEPGPAFPQQPGPAVGGPGAVRGQRGRGDWPGYRPDLAHGLLTVRLGRPGGTRTACRGSFTWSGALRLAD